MIGEHKKLKEMLTAIPKLKVPTLPTLEFYLSMNITDLIYYFFSLLFSAWTSAGFKVFGKRLPTDGG